MSEFFADEPAHALHLGRGTAALQAWRARTWQQSLPATLAAMRDGVIDERRAGVLADALQHTRPELARAVEAGLLPEAGDLSLAELRRRALAAELTVEDAAACHALIDALAQMAKADGDPRPIGQL